MLVRRVCSIFCIIFCSLAVSSCTSKKSTTPARQPDSGNSSAVPSFLPLQGIPKKIHRRYVNHDGAEAYIYSYQNRTFVLTHWNDFGGFQLVPFSSAVDPVILPLPNGQALIASEDQILLRHGCPELGCAFNEIIKAPTDNPVLGFDAVSVADGSGPRDVLMVDGTSSIYTFDLLRREWRKSAMLPGSAHASAIKGTSDGIFVLDQNSNQVWHKKNSEATWQSTSVVATQAPLQGLAILANDLVVFSGSKLWAASLTDLDGAKTSPATDSKSAWRELSSPDDNPILQLSADATKLYCTTALGDTYQLDSEFLKSGGDGKAWFSFTPSANISAGSEQIQNATSVDGELLAFTPSGVAHSPNDGISWVRETAAEDQEARLDEVSYGKGRYAITANVLLKKDTAASNWTHIGTFSTSCSTGDANQTSPLLRGDQLIKIDDKRLLIVLASAGNDAKQGCIFHTQENRFEPLAQGLQRSPYAATFVVAHGEVLAASQSGVQLWSAAEHRWLDPTETSSSNAESSPKSITAASSYGPDGVIVATSAGAVYHAQFSKSRLGEWSQFGDSMHQLPKNLPASFGRVVAIWVNPERLSEIYLLVSQTSGMQLYSRDKTDSYFWPADLRGDAPLKFVDSSDGALFAVGKTEFDRIVTNRPPPGTVEDYEQRFGEKIQNWIKEPASWITGFLGSYAIAVFCVLTLRYFPRNPILGRNWLASFIVKPFTIVPLSGHWILFLGYRRRLLRLIERNGPYFGLPALLPSGKMVAPDASGSQLLDAVFDQLAESKQVLLTGRPGGGKSMLLSRIAVELIQPGPKKNKWLPIVITSDDYNGDLVESVSTVLRERFGIPFDKEDMLLAQMQVGGILVLFDGLSEVSTSRAAAVADLQRVSKMPEFSKCALLVATRWFKGTPEFPECKVLPVTGHEAVTIYLPLFSLEPAARLRVEANLLGFGEEPIDVQLLAMTIEASNTQLNQQRHQIFISFFRKRLSAEGEESNERWDGLSLAQELIAKAFCVDTGVKSVGLSPRALIDSIQIASDQQEDVLAGKDLLSELRDNYGIEYSSGVALLDYLKSVGILIRVDRWKFAHDTFEEFFCAIYLLRILKTNGHLPDLLSWRSRPQEFREIFDFLYEMAEPEIHSLLSKLDLPAAWRHEVDAQLIER